MFYLLKHTSSVWLVTLIGLTVGLSASAQTKGKKLRRTKIDFEDQLIQGEVKKPELFYLLQKKQFNFGKLIKLRENFIPEMTKTAEDLDRSK